MASAPQALDWTLAELAAQFDDRLGRETGVAELVTGWVSATEILARFDPGTDFMAAHERRLAAAYARGDGPPGHPGKVLARRITNGATKPRERVLRSDNVKLHDPRGHAQACLPVVYARLGGPPQPFGPEPLCGQWWTDLERISAQRAQFTTGLKRRRDALVALMDEAQWNDTIYITTDGFKIGRQSGRRFNAKAYVELVGEDRAEALMTVAPAPKPSEGPPRYAYFLTDRPEDAQLDEYDAE